MTNGEKYKTAEERAKGFETFCFEHICAACPLNAIKPDCGDSRGQFAWLDLEAEEVEDDVVAKPLPCPFCGCTDVVMQDVGGFELACLGCGFTTPAYMEKEKLIYEYQRVARAVLAAKESEAK